MNEQHKRLPYSYEAEVLAAWREQLAEAAENPWLAGVLLEHGERILRRFVHFYQQLRALSRRAQRHIQRRLTLSLGAAALLLALSSIQAPLAFADTITVDGTVCTLADAITAANTDTATGDCPKGNGADVLNVTNDITLNTALPAITTDITIEGNGHTIQRDGAAPQFRILEVNGVGANNGDLTLNEATISGGDADTNGGGVRNSNGTVTIENSTISGNSAGVDGGGVFNVYGTLTIENSTISGNTAAGTWADGGGVTNYYGTVTIENSTISGNTVSGNAPDGGGVYNVYGTLTIENSTISGNSAGDDGGGVANYWGTVSIANSTISGNTAAGTRGGGGMTNYRGTVTINNSTISGNEASGGGGGVCDFYGTVSIENSTISGNTADWGGGVSDVYGTVSIENSTISGNTADWGGGVTNYYGTVTINNSTISGNTADWGGGVTSYYGMVTINNSTISGNTASSDGGGVHNYYGTVSINHSTISGNTAAGSHGDGGGVYNCEGTINIENSTISGNSASSDGGGLYSGEGTVNINHSTISGNTASSDGGGVYNYDGSLTINSSIVSGNTATSDGNEVYNDGTVNANDYNLFGDSSENNAQAFFGFAPTGTDINATSDGANPTSLNDILAPLADNGGPTETHALVPGSPAIDYIPTGQCNVATDQRGVTRPQPAGGNCDVGAYELEPDSAPFRLFLPAVARAVAPGAAVHSAQVGAGPGGGGQGSGPGLERDSDQRPCGDSLRRRLSGELP